MYLTAIIAVHVKPFSLPEGNVHQLSRKGVNIRETENKMSESSYWQENQNTYKKREERKEEN